MRCQLSVREDILSVIGEKAITYAAVDPYYVLGPLDEIVVNLWGKETQTITSKVDDTGFITLTIKTTAGEDVQTRPVACASCSAVDANRFASTL